MSNNKDWTGNSKAVFSTLSASSHSDTDRQNEDYYATPPFAVIKLLEKEKFNHYIWECAAGELHISNTLEKNGYKVRSTDIVDRTNGKIETLDFLTASADKMSPDIITNPLYKYATEFVEHALNISMDSVKVAMFLKIQFLESQKRRELFEKYPPKKIYVFTNRVNCGKNGVFGKESSAVCYCWFIWEKGFTGKPIVDWI